MKDKIMAKLLAEEKARQRQAVNLIASENYVSADVLAALGSVLTNKYAEGYPAARYYGGNEVVDKIETLCQKRALDLFVRRPGKKKNWAVNVQPLSGSPANLAVYLALVPPGGKIMGLRLADGGHLTHGHPVSASGKLWQQIPYGVDQETELLDYADLRKIAIKEKPHLIVAGFTAYSRVVDWQKFRAIADAAGAYLLVDMSHLAGLIAGRAYPDPFPYADVVTTTTHKTLRGPRAALVFSRTELTGRINKAIFPGLQGGPHLNQIAATAICLAEAATPAFRTYAKQVIKNAQTLAGELTRLGWRIVSGGTDSHLFLVDTWQAGQGISGGEASRRLEKEGIIVNKNTIPFDKRKPTDPSGIRLGTAAETTRGKKAPAMIKLAGRIDKILRA
ncbi:MAG: serine hydroxymethyltransferase [Candidatus Paceibacterota bacterium]